MSTHNGTVMSGSPAADARFDGTTEHFVRFSYNLISESALCVAINIYNKHTESISSYEITKLVSAYQKSDNIELALTF